MKVSMDVDSYKSKFLGGARQYLFFAMFNFPGIPEPEKGSNEPMFGKTDNSLWKQVLMPFGYGSNQNVIPYLVRSTSIPESSFEEISIPFPGIPFKMAGGRSYGDWQVSFNVDEGGQLLTAFNSWQDTIYKSENRKSNQPNKYMMDQDLFLLDGTGEAKRCYTLKSAWPKVVGQTSFDYSSTEIATVDVTFSYQFYTVDDTKISKTSNDPSAKSLMKSLVNKLTGSSFNVPRLS